MHIRLLTDKDIDFALGLAIGEGWASIRSDFEELIRYYANGCFLGEIDGRRVGLVTALNYGKFGFIGNLLVDEKFRGSGFGSQLMCHAINYLRDEGLECVMLDGIPKARSLYERFGFRKVCKSLRLEGRIEGRQSDSVRHMEPEDIPSIQNIDRHQFGSDRSMLITSWSKRDPTLCFVLEIDDNISGYIMGSMRSGFVRIGPWVMQNHYDRAHELLYVIADETKNSLLRIGVLEANGQANKILTEYGLIQYAFSWRMVLGQSPPSEMLNSVYAIASPARG